MKPMTDERFAALVAAHGGEPARWPDDERDAALRHLEGSMAARQALDDARRIDAWLDADAIAPPRAALRMRVLSDAAREMRLRAPAPRRGFLARLWDELGGLRIAGPAFAASIALGVAMSAWQLAPMSDLQGAQTAADDDLIELAQLDTDYSAFDEATD